MEIKRLCLYCGEAIGLNWARGNRKYCDDTCRGSFYYYKYKKQWFDRRYKEQKRLWERSANGKRGGIPIRIWIDNFPEEWKPFVNVKKKS